MDSKNTSRDLSMDSCRLNQDLAQAVDLFVMTKFQECFVVCKNVINAAKMEAEQERNDVIIEAASALGIQALAEVDCWMETPAFITHVYGNVDQCPARIIQVCILLHAHVREYLPCHSMVQAWLKNPQNLSMKQCGQVVRIYSAHVLCPTGSQGLVKEIVDKCISLTQDEKSMLLQQSLSQISTKSLSSSSREYDKPCPSMDDSLLSQQHSSTSSHFHHPEFLRSLSATTRQSLLRDSHEKESPENDGRIRDPLSWIQDYAIEGFSRICHFFAGKFKLLHNPGVQLFVMGVVAVMALMHTQTGDVVSSLSRFVVLWRGFLQKIFKYLIVP